MEIYRSLARLMPSLKLKLLQARLPDTPEYYLKKTVFTSSFLTLALCFIIFTFTSSLWAFLLFFPIFPFSFFYFLNYVSIRIERMKKDINREIVYAGRFLIIELESGVPLYQAFINLSKNYETVGVYFDDLIQRVNLGTPLDEAIDHMIIITPSQELRKMLWQILNSLKTGSKVSNALNAVFDQVVREQQIAVKEYGRKLNPMAMFYMMIAIIVPSLGTIMLIVVTSFIGIQISLIVYLILAGGIGFLQFLFLAVIKSSRPPTDM